MSATIHPRGGSHNSLKRLYHGARHLPDRLLHHRRFSTARRQILELGSIRSILVVCYGNVCRSPYLEAVLRRSLPEISLSSAGFISPGRPVPTHSLLLASARGIDLSTFRSRPLGRANVAGTDLVVVMDSKQARHIWRQFRISPSRIVIAGDLDPVMCETRGIRDPWGRSADVFASTFDRLDRCASSLVRLLHYRC